MIYFLLTTLYEEMRRSYPHIYQEILDEGGIYMYVAVMDNDGCIFRYNEEGELNYMYSARNKEGEWGFFTVTGHPRLAANIEKKLAEQFERVYTLIRNINLYVETKL